MNINLITNPEYLEDFDFARDFIDTLEWLAEEATFGSDFVKAGEMKTELTKRFEAWSSIPANIAKYQDAIEKGRNSFEYQKSAKQSREVKPEPIPATAEKSPLRLAFEKRVRESNDPNRFNRLHSDDDPKEVHWTEQLTKEYETAHAAASAQTVVAAKRVNTDLMPELGKVVGSETALALGFPKEVDALIVKAALSPEQTEHLLSKFSEMFALSGKVRTELAAITVTGPDDTAAIAKAKELHKLIRDERINSTNKKKRVKEPYLRPSQLIDGVFRIWMDEIEPLENEAKEKAEYVENLEKERLRKLGEERFEKMTLFAIDSFTAEKLAEMDEQSFELIYQGAIAQYNAKKAEEARLEQERLDKQREAEAERKRLEEENRKLAAERAEQQRLVEAERKQREAVEAELKRQADEKAAEERRLAEIEEQKRLAPDKEKLLVFAAELENLKFPRVESEKAQQLLDTFTEQVMTAAGKLAAEAEKL